MDESTAKVKRTDMHRLEMAMRKGASTVALLALTLTIVNCGRCGGDLFPEGVTEQCTNGIDDDENGKIDCADENCAGVFVCLDNLEHCYNGFDDDGNGQIDCNDDKCASATICLNSFENCSNGTDDDGDGTIDCADSSCANTRACVSNGEDCGDGQDNDNDGDADCDDATSAFPSSKPTCTSDLDGETCAASSSSTFSSATQRFASSTNHARAVSYPPTTRSSDDTASDSPNNSTPSSVMTCENIASPVLGSSSNRWTERVPCSPTASQPLAVARFAPKLRVI